MRLMLLTTALTGALTGLALAPAYAQDSDRDGDSERSAVSPQEYFGDRDEGDQDADRDADGDATVTVTITGVEPDGGELYVALQDETGFAQKGGAYTQTATAEGRSVRVTFEGVAPGEYAVAAFQDADGDGDVTIGRTGPSEPWGVSGGTPRRGAPTFDDAMIDVEGETRARLRLIGGQDSQATRRASGDEEASEDRMNADGTVRRATRRADARRANPAGDDMPGDDADGTLTAADRVMRADEGRDGQMAMDTAQAPAAGDSTLTVTITGVEPDGGEVYVALQEQDGFAKKDGAYTQTASADGRTVTVTFDGVEPGDYAVAAFQDTDGNGDLTLRRTGPTEAWGFSGRVARNAAPRFDDASISVDGTTRTRVRLSGGEEMGGMRAATSRGDRDDMETRGSDMDDSDMDMGGDDMAMMDTDRSSDRGMDSMASDPADRPRRALTDRAAMTGGTALVYRRSAALAPDALTARDYLGAELTNRDGEEIATVEDVILDGSGQAVGVVIATGGLFGIGQDYYAVTFDRVRATVEDGEVSLVSTLAEADVDRLREFDLDEFKQNLGDRRLASDLAGADVRVGSERGEVEDVVMGTSGAVEAVVLDYEGARYIVGYTDLERMDDGYALSSAASDVDALVRYEGRRGEPRTVRERVLGERR